MPGYSDIESRTIEVQAAGTLEAKLDCVRAAYTIEVTKPKVESAKESVDKRVKYLLFLLYENGVRSSQREIRYSVKHLDNSCSVTCRVVTTFEENIQAYITVTETLMEKIPSGLSMSEPVYFVSDRQLDHLRRTATVQATKNAHLKAWDIAQLLQQKVFRPLVITEVSNGGLQELHELGEQQPFEAVMQKRQLDQIKQMIDKGQNGMLFLDSYMFALISTEIGGFAVLSLGCACSYMEQAGLENPVMDFARATLY
eukprot:Clim_evm14s53 gene=Clim_evmTU14s53